jgi:hypothetical protein
MSQRAVPAAAAALLGYTLVTKPRPYPPESWSDEASKFPEYIRLGLGPYHYFCEEKGATTPIDRIPISVSKKMGISDVTMMHRIKPGLDSGNGGFVATSPDSYKIMEQQMWEFFLKFGKSNFNLFQFLQQADIHLVDEDGPSVGSVVSRVSMKLNLSNRNYNTIVSFEDRRENEEKICKILETEFGGTYHRLPGNQSLGMSPVLLDALRSRDLVFETPWTVFDLSAGFGRHWPDARGVWIFPAIDDSRSQQIVVWINHEDHMEIVGVCDDGDIVNLTRSVSGIRERILQRLSGQIAQSTEFGFLSSKPENCGNATLISRTMQLGRLSKHGKYGLLLQKLGIAAIPLTDPGNFNVSSTERFGVSSEESAARAEVALKLLAQLEQMLTDSKIRETEQIIDKIVSA